MQLQSEPVGLHESGRGAPVCQMRAADMTDVTSYTELIAGIDAGRVEMGLRHLDFEVLIGVTQGHWGKAAGMLQVKKLGIEKIFDALRGAGLMMRLEVDPEQRAKMVARCADNFNPMHANQARPRHSSTLPSTPVLNRVMQPWRKIGGKKRWAGKSKKEISEHMRMMAMARVRKERKAKRVAQRRRQRERERCVAPPAQIGLTP